MASASARSVLVTGSTDARALGYTVARLPASPPHDFGTVILSSLRQCDPLIQGRRQEAADEAATTLRAALPQGSLTKVHTLVLDVTSSEFIKSAATLLEASDGPLSGGPLDVLVNNAGVSTPPGRAGKGAQTMFLQTQDTTTLDILQVVRTNVGGVVYLTNALLPHLSKSRSPRIVYIGSSRGSIAFASSVEPASTGAMVYNASKAALNMVTVMQAKNLPAFVPGLKVNAGSPGHVKTPFNNYSASFRLLWAGMGRLTGSVLA